MLILKSTEKSTEETKPTDQGLYFSFPASSALDYRSLEAKHIASDHEVWPLNSGQDKLFLRFKNW